MLDKTKIQLLEDLKRALQPSDLQEAADWDSGVDFDAYVLTAKKHAVLSLLYDVHRETKGLSIEQKQVLKHAAVVTVRSDYRLLFLTKYVSELMRKHNITAVVLKGVATASFYPVPELRKAGDLDILIPDRRSFVQAVQLLKSEGFVECEDQSALHHTELKNPEGISVEVHSTLAEPFESKAVNRYLKDMLPLYAENVETDYSWGIAVCRPTDAYHAFYLVLHMLQHFLRAGFGLKFLCDWVVFWNRSVTEEEKQLFLHLIKESKTEGFVVILTAACVRYLGLSMDNAAFLLQGKSVTGEDTEVFMEEIFAAGEFGHGKEERMVAMRGTGFFAFAREFHHQMHLNYPKTGKIFFLWPILWAATFGKFYYNNRVVRGVRGRDVIKEAAKRSRLIDQMKLFS